MLLYEKAGNIGILTINRPEALNALNSALLDCLYEKVTEIAHDTELRCLIVTGAGKAFVAGADISEMKDLSRPEAFAFGMHGHKAFCALENLAVPVIAAVNGYALGGGCELSLCADIRIASEKAKFGQAAVAANLASSVMLIIVALSGLGNFCVPDYSTQIAASYLRIAFVIAAWLGGLLGLAAALVVFTAYLANMKSFGVPFLAPFAPKTLSKRPFVIRGKLGMHHRAEDYMNTHGDTLPKQEGKS